MLAANIFQDLHTNKGVTANNALKWKIKFICSPTSVSPTINKYNQKYFNNFSLELGLLRKFLENKQFLS